MKNGWGVVAGLGMAGLLVAGTPAWATGGSTASDKSADRDKTHSGSTGSTSDTTMGTPSGSTGTSSDSTSKDQHASTAMGATNEVTGKVQKFDKTSKELTLSLKVSDTTQVTKDGQRASLTDIKEGDQVRASFSGSGDSLEVTQIEVMSKGSPGSKSKSGGMGSSGSTGTTPSPTDSGSTGTTPTTPSPTDTGTTPSPTDSGSKGRGY